MPASHQWKAACAHCCLPAVLCPSSVLDFGSLGPFSMVFIALANISWRFANFGSSVSSSFYQPSHEVAHAPGLYQHFLYATGTCEFRLEFDLWFIEPQECFPGQRVALMVQRSFLDPIPSLRDAGEKAGLRHIPLAFICVSCPPA